MTTLRKLSLSAFALLTAATLHAQIEVTHLIMKGQSATGLGGFLHGGFPIGKSDEIGLDGGFQYFAPGQSHLIFIPLLVSYRLSFNGDGTGFYLEPFAGYTAGSTDIQKLDASGNPVYNSDSADIDQKASGLTAGLGVGYILPSARLPINFGLRYQHVFVSGDPTASMLSFRVSWSVFTARRLQKP